MNSLSNCAYRMIDSSSLEEALHNRISSLVAYISSNPITTVITIGLLGINLGGAALGKATSRVTKEYVVLNNFVPQFIRNVLRNFGRAVARGMGQISNVFGVNQMLIRPIVIVPVIEELVFRFPLLLASWKINDLTSEFFCLPILEGITDITGAQATMVVLSILSSIAFTYGHDNNPLPDRATGLFAGGLALSHLTLRPSGGLGNAIVAHMIHNLTAYFCGILEIGNGILSMRPDSQIESVEKEY